MKCRLRSHSEMEFRHAARSQTGGAGKLTRALPYTQTGLRLDLRRERPDTVVEFTMSRSQWDDVRRNDIELVGIAAVRAQLGTARCSTSPAT